jgi:adenosylcobinamide kinase/adenosylcobinamide-phosphate guanylyltransferase
MAAVRRTCLVLGGARSGKSSFAERLVAESGLGKVYLATGRAWDGEMQERIAAHKAQRGPDWTTIEEPLELAGALEAASGSDRIVLVDCLTLWLTNVMMAERDVEAGFSGLVEALPRLAGPVILVSNEVGLGIVPENRMARDFRDHAGRLHQKIAALADAVVFVAAGLPLRMKG